MTTADDFAWQDKGSCAGKKPDIWFKQENQETAIQICNKCPVEAECLRYALRNERFGVWGGTTPEGRRKIRLRRNINLDPPFEAAYRAARTTPRKAEP